MYVTTDICKTALSLDTRSLVYQENRKHGSTHMFEKQGRSVSVLLTLLVHHIGQSGFDKFEKVMFVTFY